VHIISGGPVGLFIGMQSFFLEFSNFSIYLSF